MQSLAKEFIMTQANPECDKPTMGIIMAIIARTRTIRHGLNGLTASMDIIAANRSCPIRLDDLLAASDADFAHDVLGIFEHINRETGELDDCWTPRFAASSADSPPQKEYTFDVKLWAVARVTADSEQAARDKLANYADCLDIGLVSPDGVKFTEASSEGSFDLIEIDGEAI